MLAPTGGKDITAALKTGLKRLQTTFYTLDAKQQMEIASSLIALPSALYAWDITSLKHSDPENDHIASVKTGGVSPSGVSPHYTATVNGEVYGTDAINYILFGAIMRLCFEQYPVFESEWWFPPARSNFDLSSTLATVNSYRWATNLLDGSGFYSARAFAEVGWTGNWKYIVGEGLKGFTPNKTVFSDANNQEAWLHWQVRQHLPRGKHRHHRLLAGHDVFRLREQCDKSKIKGCIGAVRVLWRAALVAAIRRRADYA